MGFGDRPNLELLRAVGELQQRCAILKEENQMLVRLGKQVLGPGGSGRLRHPGSLLRHPSPPMNIPPSGSYMELT